MEGSAALYAHLAAGATTVCQAWALIRRDGLILGFTDHDQDFEFCGTIFRASTGFSAKALQQTTGLSVDNTEAVGALSDSAVNEDDISAGRYDGAEIRVWTVNWANPAERVEQFRGYLGEIVRAGSSFRAELRGLAEQLNQVRGRVYQRDCSAVLGDAQCGVDVQRGGYTAEVELSEDASGARLLLSGLQGYAPRWFERGTLEVLDGPAAGLSGVIRLDQETPKGREIELWQRVGGNLAKGDRLRLVAGCDKRADTCRLKFDNFLNYRGFPHIPGEDWLASYPVSGRPGNGGRR
jgi:uncharacterized phage protein (TIGR02218 family)